MGDSMTDNKFLDNDCHSMIKAWERRAILLEARAKQDETKEFPYTAAASCLAAAAIRDCIKDLKEILPQ